MKGPIRRLFLGIMILVSVAGCDGKGDQAVRQSQAAKAGPETTEATPATSRASWTVDLPERPTVKEDLRVSLKGAEGDLSFAWEKNGNRVAGVETAFLPNGQFAKGDEISVTVSRGSETRRASTVVVNSLPEILSVPFADPAVQEGKDIIVRPEGVDADGDPISFRYLWSINGAPEGGSDSPVLEKSRFRKGDRVSLHVTPFDGTQEGYPFAGLEFVIPNAPPAFVSTPPTEFAGADYLYQAQARDPDDDQLVYSLEAGPQGMSIQPETGLVAWKISDRDMGEHRIRVAVQDPEGMRAVQEFSLRLALKTEGSR